MTLHSANAICTQSGWDYPCTPAGEYNVHKNNSSSQYICMVEYFNGFHEDNCTLWQYFTAVVCSELDLENGQVNYNESAEFIKLYYPGTMASFTCDEGYTLSGSPTSICQADGNWDQTSSHCGNKIKPIYPFCS